MSLPGEKQSSVLWCLRTLLLLNGCGERGYGLDQRLSGAKARAEPGWQPEHLDPEAEIARLP
jgi:hypothetical protein